MRRQLISAAALGFCFSPLLAPRRHYHYNQDNSNNANHRPTRKPQHGKLTGLDNPRGKFPRAVQQTRSDSATDNKHYRHHRRTTPPQQHQQQQQHRQEVEDEASSSSAWKHPLLSRRRNKPSPSSSSSSSSSSSYSLDATASTRRFSIVSESQRLIGAFQQKDVCLIQAPTGCGKSTMCPIYMLEALYRLRLRDQGKEKGVDADCDCDCVWVTQPTRIACKRLASFVANQMLHKHNSDIKLGQQVGYAISQEARFCADKSRIVFATPSYALQYFLAQERQIEAERVSTNNNNSNNEKRRRRRSVCSALIIDEAHCRDIEMELLMAWAKRNLVSSVQRKKETTGQSETEFRIPLQKFVIMSATIDTSLIVRSLQQDESGSSTSIKQEVTVERDSSVERQQQQQCLLPSDEDFFAALEETVNKKEEKEEAAPMIAKAATTTTASACAAIHPDRVEILRLFTAQEEKEEEDSIAGVTPSPSTTTTLSPCHPFPVQSYFATTIHNFPSIPKSLRQKLGGFSAAHDRLFLDFSITRYTAIANLALHCLKPRSNVVVYVAGLAEMLSLYYALSANLLRRVDAGHDSEKASSSAVDVVQEFVVNTSYVSPDGDDGDYHRDNNKDNIEPPHVRLAGDHNRINLVMLHSTEIGEVSEHLRNAKCDMKIILSTNVTENSVTLPNVGTVIDLGIERVECVDQSTGGQTLSTRFISKGSMLQRRGRVGRTQPGVAIHLYSPSSLRGEFQASQLHCVGAERLVLRLKGHVPTPALQGELLDLYPYNSAFSKAADFYESVEAAVEQLYRQGALTTPDFATSELTSFGQIVAALPLSVEMTRFVVMGLHLGCLNDCIVLAAAMSLPDLFTRRMITDAMKPTQLKDAILSPLRRRIQSFEGELSEVWGLRNVLLDWYNTKDRQYVHKAAKCFANYARLRCVDVLVQTIVWRVMQLLAQYNREHQKIDGREDQERSNNSNNSGGEWKGEIAQLKALRWRVQDHSFEQMERSLSPDVAKRKRNYVMHHDYSNWDIFAEGERGKRRIMEAFIAAFARHTIVGAPTINPAASPGSSSSSGSGQAQRILNINSLDITQSCLVKVSLSNPRLQSGVIAATLRATLLNLLGLFGVRLESEHALDVAHAPSSSSASSISASPLLQRFDDTMFISTIGIVQNGRQCIMEFGRSTASRLQQQQREELEKDGAMQFKPLPASPEVLQDEASPVAKKLLREQPQSNSSAKIVSVSPSSRSPYNSMSLAIPPTGALVVNFLVRRLGATLRTNVNVKLPAPPPSDNNNNNTSSFAAKAVPVEGAVECTDAATAPMDNKKTTRATSTTTKQPHYSSQQFVKYNASTRQIEITLQRKHQAAVRQQRAQQQRRPLPEAEKESITAPIVLRLELDALKRLGLHNLCPAKWFGADTDMDMPASIVMKNDETGQPATKQSNDEEEEGEEAARVQKEAADEEQERIRLETQGDVCEISFGTPTHVNVVVWNYGLQTHRASSRESSVSSSCSATAAATTASAQPKQQHQKQSAASPCAYCPLCHRWCSSYEALQEHRAGYSHALRLLQACVEERSFSDVVNGTPPALLGYCAHPSPPSSKDATLPSPNDDINNSTSYSYATFARARLASYSSPLETLVAAPHRALPILGVAATAYSVDNSYSSGGTANEEGKDRRLNSALRLRNLSVLNVLDPSTVVGYLLTCALRRRKGKSTENVNESDDFGNLFLLVSKRRNRNNVPCYARCIALMIRPLNIVVPFHTQSVGCLASPSNGTTDMENVDGNPLVDSIVRLMLAVSENLSVAVVESKHCSKSTKCSTNSNVLKRNKNLRRAIADCERHLLPLPAAAATDDDATTITTRQPLTHHRISMQDTFEWVAVEDVVKETEETGSVLPLQLLHQETTAEENRRARLLEFVDAMVVLTLRDSIEAHKFRDSLADFEGRLLLRLGAAHSTQSLHVLLLEQQQREQDEKEGQKQTGDAPSCLVSDDKTSSSCNARKMLSDYCVHRGFRSVHHILVTMGCWFEADGVTGAGVGGVWQHDDHGSSGKKRRRKWMQGDAGIVYFNVPCVVSSIVPAPA